MKKLILVALVGFVSSVFPAIPVNNLNQCRAACGDSFTYTMEFNNNDEYNTNDINWILTGKTCGCRNDSIVQIIKEYHI